MFAKPRRTGISLVGLLLAGVTLSHAAVAGLYRYKAENSATDPDYIGFQVATVVIRVQCGDDDANAVLNHFLKKELRKRGVTAYLYDDIFPTTESWNDESMRAVYETLSIDGIMLVERVSEAGSAAANQSSGHSRPQRYSAVSHPARSDQPSGRYGGGPAAAVGEGGGVRGSAPHRMHRQFSQHQVALVDWDQGREVWRSTIETRVGYNHSKHQQIGKGTARGIVEALAESEHMPQD